MTTFEGGPVKKFDNLKIKTPEEIQADQKTKEDTERGLLKAEEDKKLAKNNTALDAAKNEREADKVINDIPDDPNNPTEQWIKNNETQYLQYLKENPSAVDGIQAKIKFMKNELAKKNDKSGEVDKSGEKTIRQEKPKNFLDAMSTLIEKSVDVLNKSGIIDQISKIMLQLKLINPKNKDYLSHSIDLAFLESKSSIKDYLKTPEGEKVSQGLDSVSFMKKLNAYRWEGKPKTDKNGEEYFDTNYENSEKEYFTLLSPENQIKYILRDITDTDFKLTDSNGKNIPLRKKDGFDNKTIKKDQGKIINGKEQEKPSDTQIVPEQAKENPNIIKVKVEDIFNNIDGINNNLSQQVKEKFSDGIPMEIKGQGDDLYIEGIGGVSPIRNGIINIYLPSIDGKFTIQKSLSVKKDKNGLFNIAVIGGKKDLPIDDETILKSLNDNSVFDLWKTNKLALSLSNDDIKNNNVDQAKAHALILKYHKEFDKLGTNQRIKESLQKTLTNLKTELLAITPEDKKKSAWSDLDRIEIGS